ncbi:MAG: hypothetical protein IJP37_01625 [Clostridia bacterium]|nr:hypothetical protein [Clostridia bacterium]
MVQRIAPHTLPPQGGRQTRSPTEKNQPLPPALLLARRIRREQGAEQVRRFLAAMEPFLAPNERQSIAEQLGIRLQTQNPPPKGNQRQTESAQMPTSHPEEPQPRQRPNPQNDRNNDLSNLAQQVQLLQMLSQMGNQGGGFNPMLLSQLMNGMNGGKR